MKKIYLLAALAGGLLISVSCSGSHSHENHAHEEQSEHEHEHSEEEHDHDEHEDHDHEGHSHEHGEHVHSDEIILKPEKAQTLGVKVEAIQPKPFRQVIVASGQVQAAQGDEATVVANVDGMVSFGRSVTEGMSVARGASLITIVTGKTVDGDPAERAKVAYETAKEEYERASKLLESQIVSGKEFATIKQNYTNAKLSYEALSAGAKGNGRQSIVAPIGGYVKSCLVKEGDYVTVGQPLMSITQNHRLFLRAEVSEKYYKYLSRIQSANFKTPYDDTVYQLDQLHGKVLSYGKTTDQSSFFVPITFEFDNRVEVVPGSYVEVYLLSSEMPDVLALPKSAITEEQGLYFVYLQLDEEGYKKQEITLGADNGQETEIRSGLKAGDRVVVSGAIHVKLASASNAIPAHTHNH